MHPRQRSPGNGGYRAGMGLAAPPRSLSEGSMRGVGGHGFYASSDYPRHLNRDGPGFGRGRGHPKPFFQPPPRKADIFMEAGRLAVEYLVSQGLLPPAKKAAGELPEFTTQDGEPLQFPSQGRLSALARLGNSLQDYAPGRRRFAHDEFNPKFRRRGGSFRTNSSGSDWNRRNGSWSERPRASPERMGDDDATTRRCNEEQQEVVTSANDGVHKSDSNEFSPKSENGGNSGSNDPSSNEVILKACSSGASTDVCEIDMEPAKRSDDLEEKSAGMEEMKNAIPDVEYEKQNVELDIEELEGNPPGTNSTDLLTLSKFAKVPTRTRSSLTSRGLKVDQLQKTAGENIHDIGSLSGNEVLVDDESLKVSSSVPTSNKTSHNLEHHDSEVGDAVSVEDANKTNLSCIDNQVTCPMSHSSPDTDFVHESDKKFSLELPRFGSCAPMVKERGEKRGMEDGNIGEGTKKLRVWLPSTASGPQECFQLNPIDKKDSSEEDGTKPDNQVAVTSGHGSLINTEFQQGGDKPYIEYTPEEQPLPSSFRICDLNLTETSEIHENHGNDAVLIYPSVPETKKGSEQVDIDLSTSHSTASGAFSSHQTNGRQIEVIDLENDSPQDGKVIDDADRGKDTMFPGLDGFSNHAQSSGDISDIQDGYGLMLSELLGTDFPNCSSVPGDINSMHNEIGLHNGEGALAEDDSIYMSLGEIPLSFIRTWEQPPSREYKKPF